jgi:hypothetical protein
MSENAGVSTNVSDSGTRSRRRRNVNSAYQIPNDARDTDGDALSNSTAGMRIMYFLFGPFHLLN